MKVELVERDQELGQQLHVIVALTEVYSSFVLIQTSWL